MTGWLSLLLVAVGGAAGASARWAVAARIGTPRATLLVNVLGSLLLGLLAGAEWLRQEPSAWALLATGFCGALTTFSTFAVEVRRTGTSWALLHLALCLPAAALGLAVAG